MKIALFRTLRVHLCATGVAFGVLSGSIPSVSAQNLLAHWTFDIPQSTTWPDSSTNQCALYQDTNTATALLEPGLAGYSTWLNWSPTPGTSTRLYATNSALQTDSFGFSFWIQPVYLNDFDNFIIKEAGYNSSVPGYAALAWQVHMLGNNGSGAAPIEFIVRGQNGGFFAVVQSSTNLTLHTGSSTWFHIAGGYDSTTGQISLFVNGVEADAAGNPGAFNSDGSPFDVGTGANGPNYVAFAAGTYIDDLQLYDAPLNATNVAFLMANPGYTIGSVVPQSIHITSCGYNRSSGDMTVAFTSANSLSYAIQGSTNLSGWQTLTNITATDSFTTNTLPSALISSVFGPNPPRQLFIRIQN